MLPLLLAISATAELRLQERAPLPLLIVAPSGQPGHATRSDLIRVVSKLLTDRTDLVEEVLPPTLVDDCAAAVPCLSSAVDPAARLLLILTQITGASDEGDLLSTMLVDTVEATVLHRTSPTLVKSPEETTAFVDRLFFTALRPIFEARGHWEPYGVLEVRTPGPGFELFLDDRAVGATEGPHTIIRNVLPRTRILRVEHPDYLPLEMTVEVVRNETAVAEAAPIARPNETVSALRIAFFWTGVATAVGGAAALIYAVADTGDEVTQCLYVEGHRDACAPGSDFRTTRYSADRGIAGRDTTNPPGVLLAPLGYSLLGVGVTWALTILFTDETDGLPWLPLGLGLVGGAGAYGLSAALD